MPSQLLFLVLKELDLVRVLLGPWSLWVLREAIRLQLILESLDFVFEVFLLCLEVVNGLSLISHFLLEACYLVLSIVVVYELGMELILLLGKLSFLILDFLLKLVIKLVDTTLSTVLKPLVFFLKSFEGIL